MIYRVTVVMRERLRPAAAGRSRSLLAKRLLGERPAGWPLLIMASVVGVVMTLPAAYIVLRALEADAAVWARLWETSIPYLLFKTVTLTLAVTFLTIAIAVPAAWLVSFTDVPGSRLWQWLLALPLAIPPYIGGFAYITVFGPRGLAQQQLSDILGVSPYELNIPSIYGFAGVTLVLSVFTYPYVFLLVSSALKSQNQGLIDAARISGLSTARVFFRVTTPLLRPSIAAGGLLVALYVLSDFGAVTMLRYQTFTSVIYQQLIGRYDRQAAAALSLVLMLLTIFVVTLEWRSRRRSRYYQTTGSSRPADRIRLGRWRWVALAGILVILLFSLFIPLTVLSYWTALGFWRTGLDPGFRMFMMNSIVSSGIAATLVVVMALPVAYLVARHDSVFTGWIKKLSYAGYALPGVLIGLGMVFFFNSALPWFYGTTAVLILGYIIRFLPQCLQAEESGLAAISPSLEEAARSLGRGTAGVIRSVTLPLMMPAVAAGWALVFISAMKELPATLMLRPPGFDTLAVRVWIDASEGFYTAAAAPALLLVLVSAVPLIIIARRFFSPRAGREEYGTGVGA